MKPFAVTSALGAICALLICACQSAPPPRQNSAQRTRPGDAVAAEPRIYAYSDRPLLLPLTALRAPGTVETDPSAGRWRPARVPDVRYEDDAPISTRLVYLEARPAENSGSPWLPQGAQWSVTPWEATADPSWSPAGGFWGLLIPPPPDGRRQVLRFNGAALPLIWLSAPPASTDASRAPRLDLDRGALRALGATIAPLATDPLQAWRIRILTDRLRGSELWAAPPAPPADLALGALADQLEARWRTAIGALERDDPQVAAEFVARLTAVVRLPMGEALPAWAPDDSALSALRTSLLSPHGTRASRIQAVRAWLSEMPDAVAWMIDDGAGDAPSGAAALRRAIAAIANLTSSPVIASTAPLGQSALNAARIPAHGAALFTCPIDSAAPVGPVIARAGGWSMTLPTLMGPLSVSPPGLLMGPLLPRWHMVSWLRGQPQAPDVDEACIALLQRSATDSSLWEVYVECRGSDAGDVVSLWFGPYEGAGSVVRMGPGAPEGPAFYREESRWWAVGAVPSDAIGPDGRLLIGVSRESATGSLWSWPRPMAPGQTEPARALVDLSTWGSMIELPGDSNSR